MSTVLVPLDGSPAAERALPFATALAARLSGSIALVRSCDDGDEREAQAYLDEVRDRFALGLDTAAHAVAQPPPAALDEVASTSADPVICLAAQGRSGLAHAVLGSVSEQIIAAAAVPVLVCGPGACGDLTADRGRSGLCLDRDTHLASLVPFGAAWARRLGQQVDLLTVAPEDDRPISRFHPASEDQLDDAAAQLGAAGVTAEKHELEELLPARALARYAEDHGLALLIAAKRSGTGVARDLLGSTVMNLVHRSPCPVLLPPAQTETT